MAQPPQMPRLWDLIEQALSVDDSTALHLAVGRPPMVRVGDEGLRPLDENAPPLTWKAIQLMLSLVVDPERWDSLEQVGEGEVHLGNQSGRRFRMNLFRSSGAWSVVVHL